MIINVADKFNQHLSSLGDVYLYRELLAFRNELQQLENEGLINEGEPDNYI